MEKTKNQTGIASVWMVTREYDGLAGAGGVKDVCRQLAEALADHAGCRVTVVLPRYGFMDAAALGFSPLKLSDGAVAAEEHGLGELFAVDMDYAHEERREDVSAWMAMMRGVRVILLEASRFREKQGVYTYTSQEQAVESWKRQGSGHFDFFAMNILLQKATLDLLILLDEHPDIIHCQDGHAAALPAMLRENPGYRHYFRRSGTVVTIHNAGAGYHQEVADLPFVQAVTGLPGRVVHGSRLGSDFDPFLAAAGYAVFNTVSENYARELQETSEDSRTGWLGHSLLYRGVRLAGVTNGINPLDFDPTRPERLGLPAPFDPAQGDLKGKGICKLALLTAIDQGGPWDQVEQFGRLAIEPDLPLLTFIGRLTEQKGVDILLKTLLRFQAEDQDFQILLLGSGDPTLETRLEELATEGGFKGRICFLRGYDTELSFKIYAAGDFFLIPSLYEPCGLTDYIAQLLGNLPVVHRVGGLIKVRDGETGFAYDEHSSAALALTLNHAIRVYREEPDRFAGMQAAAVRRIRERHTWEQVMHAYLDLYGQALALAGRS